MKVNIHVYATLENIELDVISGDYANNLDKATAKLKEMGLTACGVAGVYDPDTDEVFCEN